MARELLWSAGPAINDFKTYDPPLTGWSIATSPAPTHGTYIFKGVSGTANNQNIGPSRTFTAKTYVWLALRGFRLTGTLASGDDVRFLSLSIPSGFLRLNWIYETASTYKIRVKRFIGSESTVFTSTNAFNVDQWYAIRVECDGTNWTLWVDGTEEGEGAQTARPSKIDVNLTKFTLSSGQEQYYRGILLTQSDSESDRPGTAVENDRLDPTGDTAEEEGTGHPDNVDHWKNWDDYVAGGAPDDDTSYNLLDDTGQSTVSSLNTHTPTDTIEGIIFFIMERAATADKTANSHARIKEGLNSSEFAFTNLGGDSYVPRPAAFDLAPDGGAWTQSDVDALEAGLRSDSGNTVSIRATALAMELVSVDNDAPPVGAQTIRKTVYY